MKRALDMYRSFWRLEPDDVGDFPASFKIPREAILVGDAVHVMYRSGKVDPSTLKQPRNPVDYIHEHDAGVKCYKVGARASEGPVKPVPQWIQNTKQLVLLGECIGFAYNDGDEDFDTEAGVSKPYPELYTTPNGRALVVVQGRRRVVALVWGGKLGVEPRGIVH